MKKMLSIAGGLAGLALLLAVPAMAGMSTVTDTDLSGISGKAAENDYTFSAGSTVTQTETGDNSANIVVGFEQWNDDHSADASNHKGSNDQSGAASLVQVTVNESANAIQWGSAANSLFTATSISGAGDFTNMAYGVFAGGGF